nr:uncharacterized mitochondrial protein AtMg00810-like [Tanacetum cinerariifolium]
AHLPPNYWTEALNTADPYICHANPKESHLIAVKRIFRYLKGTPSPGLWYPKCLGFNLKGYSNSDYAGCNMDRKSTSASTRLAKKGPHSKDLWETFKHVKINLSFTDAIKQIVDFFVMDTESPYKDVQPTIILGRPFLATIDARINCRTGTMDSAFGNRNLQLNVFKSLNYPSLNDCYHIDNIDECIQTHTPSMNLDHTLENLHCVDTEKELFDGMTFHEREEEFQIIEEEFLLSLEKMPLHSQQVQQLTLNEVQEYFDCLLVHQDVLLRARSSNKGFKILDILDNSSWDRLGNELGLVWNSSEWIRQNGEGFILLAPNA